VPSCPRGFISVLRFRVLVPVRVPSLAFWARQDDVKRRKDASRAKKTRMLPASIRVCGPAIRPSINSTYASSLGCARPARRPFRPCINTVRGKRVAAASVGRQLPEALIARWAWPTTDQSPYPRSQASTPKGPPRRTRVFWIDALEELEEVSIEVSEIVVRSLGGLMHNSASCPNGGGACRAWWCGG
jgi:hypothetical protein